MQSRIEWLDVVVGAFVDREDPELIALASGRSHANIDRFALNLELTIQNVSGADSGMDSAADSGALSLRVNLTR